VIPTALSTNQVTANRPYLLLIRDTATGTPLFLARISDPTATG
jgi:serine protease inhibitor